MVMSYSFILTYDSIGLFAHKYNTDPFVKRLVDGAEIWINPLANPMALLRRG
jgi:hypothetical protein